MDAYHVSNPRASSSRAGPTPTTRQQFVEPYRRKNRRPFAEALVSKTVSGLSGYPAVERVLCAKIPARWKTHFRMRQSTHNHPTLVLVSTAASGVPLLELPLQELSTKSRLAIAMRILQILHTGQTRLGRTFAHADLHPGNIIVNTGKHVRVALQWQDSLLRSQKVWYDCPEVTIIDFDLSRVEDRTFKKLTIPDTFYQQMYHAMRKYKIINEVTLKMLFRCIQSYQNLANVLCRLSMSPGSFDTRNWYAIAQSLLYDHQSTRQNQLHMGRTVEECIRKNAKLMDQILSSD